MIQGCWIVELAELDGFTRAESSAAKAFFSSQHDRYVPKWVAHAVKVPRQAVFAGTVNLGTYLHDKTGNRRYWPILCGERIDVEAIMGDRNQLWAEAVHRFREGDPWYVVTGEEAMFALEQEARLTPDALEEKIASALIGTTETTMREILETTLNLQPKDWTHAMTIRVGQILHALDYEVGPRSRDGASRTRVYRKKDTP